MRAALVCQADTSHRKYLSLSSLRSAQPPVSELVAKESVIITPERRRNRWVSGLHQANFCQIHPMSGSAPGPEHEQEREQEPHPEPVGSWFFERNTWAEHNLGIPSRRGSRAGGWSPKPMRSWDVPTISSATLPSEPRVSGVRPGSCSYGILRRLIVKKPQGQLRLQHRNAMMA